MTLLAFLLAAAALVGNRPRGCVLVASPFAAVVPPRRVPDRVCGARPSRRGAVARRCRRCDRLRPRSGGAPGRVVVGVACSRLGRCRLRPACRPSRLDPHGIRFSRPSASFVGGALVYQLFIVLATPPNNWDSMSYHLPRAAEWLQRARVEYVPDPPTERINALQPGSELEILWTFAFLGRDTAARCRSSFAEVASLVGVYAIAAADRVRPARLRCSHRCSSATLTQVALQSVTTQNDLLAASFVVAAAALVLGRSRVEVRPRRARARACSRNEAHSGLRDPGPARARVHGSPAATAAPSAPPRPSSPSSLVGAYGYVLNLVETGSPLGDPSATEPYRPAEITWAVPSLRLAHLLPLLRPLRVSLRRRSSRLDRECRPLRLRRSLYLAKPA